MSVFHMEKDQKMNYLMIREWEATSDKIGGEEECLPNSSGLNRWHVGECFWVCVPILPVVGGHARLLLPGQWEQWQESDAQSVSVPGTVPNTLTYRATEHMPHAERAQRAWSNIYPRVLSPIRASELAGLCKQGVLLAWTSCLYRSPVSTAYSRANLVPTTGLGVFQNDSFVFLASSQFGCLSWQIAWDSWLS